MIGPVDHGLPVEADHVDVGGLQVVLGQKALHRLGMGFGDEGFGLRQTPRPVAGLNDGFGILRGGAQ